MMGDGSMGSSPYCYSAEWKASVDHSGPEWMAYCEAVSLVRRYLRTRADWGREMAVEEFESSCARMAKSGSHGLERSARIKQDFLLIWAHERRRLVDEVEQEVERREAS